MDKLKQLESFVTVATKGSLTATALVEGVAPAVIGRRIDAILAAQRDSGAVFAPASGL